MLLALSTLAHAQDAGFDVDTFTFDGGAWDNQGSLQLAHPRLGTPGTWYGAVGLSIANDPLVITYGAGTPDEFEQSVVSRQTALRINGGYNVGGAARIDVEIPLYPGVTVLDNPSPDAVEGDYASQFAMGDITLSALFPLMSYETEGFGLAVKPVITLPTGSEALYTGSGFSGGLVGAAGGRVGALGWRTNLGFDFVRGVALDEDTPLGSTFDIGGGANYFINESVLAGAELTSHVTMRKGSNYRTNPVEGHLYATWFNESGLTATGALGTGIIRGIGAPDWRFVLAVGYTRPGGPGDTDADGITDDVDACIDQPEDIDNYKDTDGCPDPDNDGDGLADTQDQCRDNPEDKDGFQDADGCPDPDNDGDGIPDGGDDCPLEKGTAATNGCPDTDGDTLVDTEDACPTEFGPKTTKGCPDRDSDRVPDKRDKCPDEPIDPRADPERSDGCPSRVIVSEKAIVITDIIYFDTNKTTIKKVSYPLLDEIAAVIIANPDITKIEIGGHTDSQGSDASNLKLSQGRADSVMKYLVGKGVDPARLSAKGYGEGVPKDTNDTEAGRANNRRVEFVIKEQAGKKTDVQMDKAEMPAPK